MSTPTEQVTAKEQGRRSAVDLALRLFYISSTPRNGYLALLRSIKHRVFVIYGSPWVNGSSALAECGGNCKVPYTTAVAESSHPSENDPAIAIDPESPLSGARSVAPRGKSTSEKLKSTKDDIQSNYVEFQSQEQGSGGAKDAAQHTKSRRKGSQPRPPELKLKKQRRAERRQAQRKTRAQNSGQAQEGNEGAQSNIPETPEKDADGDSAEANPSKAANQRVAKKPLSKKQARKRGLVETEAKSTGRRRGPSESKRRAYRITYVHKSTPLRARDIASQIHIERKTPNKEGAEGKVRFFASQHKEKVRKQTRDKKMTVRYLTSEKMETKDRIRNHNSENEGVGDEVGYSINENEGIGDKVRDSMSDCHVRYHLTKAKEKSAIDGPNGTSMSIREALQTGQEYGPSLRTPAAGSKTALVEEISASKLEITTVDTETAPVPGLAHGLDRVLFNPGVYHLQDPRSRVFNFDPYLQMIMPVAEFDFNALKRFITSSDDNTLAAIARQQGSKYVGSTSSMTGVLSHFHFLLSQWRELNLDMLSKGFEERLKSFTLLSRGPAAIMLRWKDGTYALDSDKELDSPTILAMLGRSLEKLMVLPTEAYERYRKSNPDAVSEEERGAAESYHYSAMGDFLMRSQLDAHDSRLPGSGMFDIKTRAVISVRMSAAEYEHGMGYQIRYGQGRWESFEREYYDMMRSTMLKYSLQVRIGRMDGIFAAYHNVERIFGFQYISLPEMDRAVHGQADTTLGDQEFKTSVDLLNKILNRATERFPNTSLRLHFETRDASVNFMYIFIEPVTEEEVESIQKSQKEKVQEYERSVLGLKPADEQNNTEDGKDWSTIMAQVKDEVCVDEMGTDESSVVELPESASQPTSEDGSNAKPTSSASETESDGIAELTDAIDSMYEDVAASNAPTDETSEKNQETTSHDSSESSERKPILALTLATRSKINGVYRVRPLDLKPTDEWKVEYSITEIESQSRAWTLYKACKRRRKDVLPPDIPDGRDDYFRQIISGYIDSGRAWRAKMDEWESRRQRVVFQAGQTTIGDDEKPLPEVALHANNSDGSEAMRGVNDYLQWIYGGDKLS
ncbi:MAG: hypothetical protein M1821_008940 [Bathelium mastoideum]|nr:MAG: hypothetical protein M1821_008940 [Bathelium mastoideum]